jgi:hypothetical protein
MNTQHNPPPGPLSPELKRALQAFKKRLKLSRLDEESNIGGRQMSGGRSSSIVAITPPDQYPQSVWEDLVKAGRLRPAGKGLYELIQ